MSEGTEPVTTFDDVQARLEQLCAEVDQLDESTRELVFELLDAVDVLHRTAAGHLAEALGVERMRQLCEEAHPAVRWLFEAYDVAPDDGIPPGEGEPPVADRGSGSGPSSAAQGPGSAVNPPSGATVLPLHNEG